MRFELTLLTIAVLACAACWTAPNPSGGVRWVKFQDSNERAFDLDVPEGWTVKGGLARLGYSDARPMVDITSPDGSINVRLGDAAIPNYFVPNQAHNREGQIYDLGAQAQLTVARYRPGAEYAAAYATMRFQTMCQNSVPQQADPSAAIKDYIPQEISPIQSTAGQATFHCSTGQGTRETSVYARTSLYQGFWQVQTLASLSAPPDQVAFARSILRQAAESFRISPQWIAHQKQLDQEALAYQQARQAGRRREISLQMAQFEMKMQAQRDQVAGFRRQQQSQAEQASSWGRTITGLTPTTDPYGNPRDVWTGPKTGYWTNGTGKVINSDLPPGAGWQPMQTH